MLLPINMNFDCFCPRERILEHSLLWLSRGWAKLDRAEVVSHLAETTYANHEYETFHPTYGVHRIHSQRVKSRGSNFSEVITMRPFSSLLLPTL